jgi:hypothetical protein
VQGIYTATYDHEMSVGHSGYGWDDMNHLWVDALNAAERGEITHFAMLHSDIGPEPGWLDVLLAELDRLDADLVSAPAPLKDGRGLTSSGIGDPANPWAPLKRFTVREILELPETFNEVDAGFSGYPLLHNTGCWAADLRKQVFYRTNDLGELFAQFNFPLRVVRNPETGQWMNNRESEDWYFSRMLHLIGANSFITRKVRLAHQGGHGYRNDVAWGSYLNGDEETRHKWAPVAGHAEAT